MNNKYKNSYIVKEKELVSLSVYNVGFQSCDSLYQWGPGIRDHYLIHYIISGKGRYTVNGSVHTLTPGDAFLVYPNTEVIYQADAQDPWEYTWVGFTGSDAATILRATDFTKAHTYTVYQTETKSKDSSCIYTTPEAQNLKMHSK